MITNYLRPFKARLTEKTAEEIEKRETLSIAKYHQKTLTPLGECKDESLRADNSLIFEDTGYHTRIDHTPAQLRLEGTTLYGGYIRLKWGHFITETIARMWALNRISHFDNVLFFADGDYDKLSGNYIIIFKLLGIEEKVKIFRNPVEVENLLVPEIGYEHDRYYSDQQAKVYHIITQRALAFNCDFEKSEKVFLSRSSVPGATKDGVNLHALEKYFEANGYTIVRPDISLIKLIHIMDYAKDIATISGTPAHNYAFILRPETTNLYIIERHAWINVFQLSLNKMLNLPTISIDAFYLPRLTSSQDSIMLFAPTSQFVTWAKSKGFTINGEFVNSRRRTRLKELRTFIKRYRRYRCSGDGLWDWEISSGESILEAVVASRERYNPWLHEALPIMWYDYLTPRALVRFILHRLRIIFRK